VCASPPKPRAGDPIIPAMSDVIPIHLGRRARERNRAEDAREREAFTTVRRGGRTFRVYDSARERNVLELPARWTDGTTAA